MNRIKFEVVSEVEGTYPYLCAYLGETPEPFIEIGITDDKELVFRFYPSYEDIQLTLEEWVQVQVQGQVFLPKALLNEEQSRAWEASHE